MNKRLNIAIVGATGAVGEALLTGLQERDFPVNELYPLASSRSLDKTVRFNNRYLPVQDLANFDFTGTDIALFSAGAAVSKIYAPIAVQAGCVVVDNTSCFR